MEVRVPRAADPPSPLATGGLKLRLSLYTSGKTLPRFPPRSPAGAPACTPVACGAKLEAGC